MLQPTDFSALAKPLATRVPKFEQARLLQARLSVSALQGLLQGEQEAEHEVFRLVGAQAHDFALWQWGSRAGATNDQALYDHAAPNHAKEAARVDEHEQGGHCDTPSVGDELERAGMQASHVQHDRLRPDAGIPDAAVLEAKENSPYKEQLAGQLLPAASAFRH